MVSEERLIAIENRLNIMEQRVNVLDIGKKNVNIKIWRDPLDLLNVKTTLVRPESGVCTLKSQTWNPEKLLLRGRRHGKLYDGPNEDHTTNTYIEFMNIIMGEKDKRTFTYCFKSDGALNLCETLHEIDDNKCKHMYVCYDKQNICSAGIMVFKKVEDSFEIYIDNMSGTYFTGDDDTEILKNSIILSFPEGDNIGNNISTISPRSNKEDLEKFCSYDGYDKKNRPTQLFENSIDFGKLCEGENAPDVQLDDMQYDSGSEPATSVDSPVSRDSIGDGDVIDNELLMNQIPTESQPQYQPQYQDNIEIPQKKSSLTQRLRRSFGNLFGAKKYQKKKRKTSTGRRQRTKRAPMKSVNTRSRNKYSKKQRKIKHTRKRHYIKPTHSFTKNDI